MLGPSVRNPHESPMKIDPPRPAAHSRARQARSTPCRAQHRTASSGSGPRGKPRGAGSSFSSRDPRGCGKNSWNSHSYHSWHFMDHAPNNPQHIFFLMS